MSRNLSAAVSGSHRSSGSRSIGNRGRSPLGPGISSWPAAGHSAL